VFYDWSALAFSRFHENGVAVTDGAGFARLFFFLLRLHINYVRCTKTPDFMDKAPSSRESDKLKPESSGAGRTRPSSLFRLRKAVRPLASRRHCTGAVP
jgi:hypothetical protein